MQIDIIKRNKNDLLEREEIIASMSFSGATPSYPQIKQALSAQLKIKEELIAIKQVLTSFGETKAKITAHVYETVEQFQKTEPKVKVKKEKNIDEKK